MNSCAEFLRGCSKVALLPKCHPQGVMHICLPGIQFCCLAQFDHGLRQLVFQFEREPEVVVQGCVLRGKLECRFEFRNGGVEVCHLQMSCSQVPFVSAVIGTQTDCRFELG